MTNFVPISYTGLVKAEDCPLHWYSVYRRKEGDTGNKKTFKGQEEHERIRAEIKAFCSGGGGGVPDGIAGVVASTLRAQGATLATETWLSVRRDLTHSPFGETPYVRAICDLLAVVDGSKAWAVDWKTGDWSPKSDSDLDMTQLQITAVAAMSKSRIDEVRPVFVYTKKQKIFPIQPVVYRREDIMPETRSPTFKALFERFARYEALQERTDESEFPAYPCRHCNYCKVVTCEHNPAY